MKKREADFGLLFRHWVKAQKNMPAAAFELKQTTKDYFSFAELKDHQETALRAVKTCKGLLYKAPDDSRSVKPFDYFHLAHACAYVVIRYPKSFHLIDIDVFIYERERSKRKSLTSERAEAISTKSVKIQSSF